MNVWAAFKQLAANYPECGAVKLTIELQRAFIAQQQRVFAQALNVVLELYGTRKAFLTETGAVSGQLSGDANDDFG